MLNVATLPGLLAIPLIILFRVPREVAEVVMPPVLVTLIGTAWLQANAWRVTGATAAGDTRRRSILIPAALAAGLLAVFQLILRPGIPFY
jgi:hypothetical protein